MSTASVELYNRLKNGAGLTGVPVTPKVREVADVYPAVTYNLVATLPSNSLQGFSHLCRFVYQVDVWARTYSQALALALAVREAAISSNTADFFAMFIDRREDYDNELKIHNVQIDFSIHSSQD